MGLHQPHDAAHFDRAFISVNRVRGRKKPVPSSDWIMDSGAFREIELFGRYRHGPEEYAAEVNRLAAINPGLKVAVAQDYMCEPFMLEVLRACEIAIRGRDQDEREAKLLTAIKVAIANATGDWIAALNHEQR